MKVVVKIKRMVNKFGNKPVMPDYKTTGAAGMDLRYFGDEVIRLFPGERRLIPTGIKAEIPPGFAGFVFARSGISVNYGITLINGVGLIDSDYRGEISVGIVNLSDDIYELNPYERIAQLAIVPVAQPTLVDTDELGETERGSGGFGSTGKI